MEPQPSGDERTAIPRLISPSLLAATYQNRLRTVGRELDVNGYRSIILLQVEGGFLVRAVNRVSRDLELLEFPDDEFPERMIAATEARGDGERPESPSPLAPTGYEDLMRGVGRWLDELNALSYRHCGRADCPSGHGRAISARWTCRFDRIHDGSHRHHRAT